MNQHISSPKMTRAQARLFWKTLTPQQQTEFNKMYGNLIMTKVTVDDNEQIQRIILEDKDKPSVSDKPFYEHFKLDKGE